MSLFFVETALASSRLFERWPRYVDEQANEWALTSVPMLIMSGALDPATPDFLATAMADHFNQPTQHYVRFPDATHNTIISTPIGSTNRSCAFELIGAFMADPGAPLNRDCVAQVSPASFADD